MARAVLPGVAHHLTQRGIDRQDVFFSNAQREIYPQLAPQAMPQFGVRVLAFCLMTNHVHWVVAPESERSLAQAFGWMHGRYAQHVNTARGRSGHLWQNRFFSCALDEEHLWAAVRYVERNPVRAGLVPLAEAWPWSSAGVRLGLANTPAMMDLSTWRERFTVEQWRQTLLAESVTEAEQRLRVSTYTGRPAGSEEFVKQAEAALNRKLAPGKGGRPRKHVQEQTHDSSAEANLFAGSAA